ncbi:hypothetical protein DIPPA_19316 [Diplonema papillatum]|nr:hypothetical protein DIPPA_19316 [Diplonema papillatum]
MSTDLVRKVTVDCGLLPPCMQYYQRESYERFLFEAYHGKGAGGAKPAPRPRTRENGNSRAAGNKTNGKIRRGLTGAPARHTEQPLPSLSALLGIEAVGPSPLVQAASGGFFRKTGSFGVKVGAAEKPASAPPARRVGLGSARHYRVAEVTRKEMVLDWPGVAISPRNPPLGGTRYARRAPPSSARPYKSQTAQLLPVVPA